MNTQQQASANATKASYSIIVVAYDMARELPRTLHSLSRAYQRDSDDIDYEVLVVDNGSPEPVRESQLREYGDQFKLIRIEDASPSPGAAINAAAESAAGDRIAIIIDGARMLSPGVMSWADHAFRLDPDCLAAVLGFHLGPEHQSASSQYGYNQAAEDKLLKRIRWPEDGYRLFEVAALAGSSRDGWLGPIAESNCLFLPRTLFETLGGFDTRFNSPGGGLINLDFYKRACEACAGKLVYLVGEGCFHQIHGGVTTGGSKQEAQRYVDFMDEYRVIHGEEFKVPRNTPVLLGFATPMASWLAGEGAMSMARKIELDKGRHSHMQAAGLNPEADRS